MPNRIYVDRSVRDNRKLKRFYRRLEAETPNLMKFIQPQTIALGLLTRLWVEAAVQERLNGSLTDWEPADIADAMGWSGDPQKLLDALKDCRLVCDAATCETCNVIIPDGGHIIHDYLEHQGSLFKRLDRDRVNKQVERHRHRPIDEAPPNGQDSQETGGPQEEIVRQLFQKARARKIRNRLDTLRTWIEAYVARGMAAKIDSILSQDGCTGLNTIEIEKKFLTGKESPPSSPLEERVT